MYQDFYIIVSYGKRKYMKCRSKGHFCGKGCLLRLGCNCLRQGKNLLNGSVLLTQVCWGIKESKTEIVLEQAALVMDDAPRRRQRI